MKTVKQKVAKKVVKKMDVKKGMPKLKGNWKMSDTGASKY
jgi:hypothetical protein